MNYIEGINRDQTTLFPETIDEYISCENPIRFIDAFVNQLNMLGMGFENVEVKETGRPPYDRKDLLKLHIYGYLNRIRSSRNLERETQRNLELMWLLKRLSPDHKTISDFRRKNSKGMQQVFKEFIYLCRKLELFGAELIAVDSTKFRACNARDMIKNSDQLEKSIINIECSISDYIKCSEENDKKDEQGSGTNLTKEELQKKISYLRKTKTKLEESKEKILESGDKYISLTDPDCRLVKNQVTIEPGYTIHTAVDSKHSLIVNYEVSQDAADNDHLSTTAIEAKERLGVEKIKVCADAGYYDSVDIKKCEDNEITAYVPIPKPRVSKIVNVPEREYYSDRFIYDESSDCYCCPQGHKMEYYHTTNKHGRKNRVYRSSNCQNCPVKNKCSTSPRGRYIYRWEEQKVIERLKERLTTEPHIMKRRKAIVEHPFGTMKKIWGYSTLLLRGLEKVSAEISLVMLTYNIKRALSIIGIDGLMKAL
jgi:transposase